MRCGLVVALMVGGCASKKPPPTAEPEAAPTPPQYVPALDPLIGPAWVQATGAYVIERCNVHTFTDRPTEAGKDPPSVHTVDAGGGVQVRQACGLVANEVYTPDYQLRFAREVCGLPDATMNDDCRKRFADMFIARLSERYASANWAAVSQHCTAYPLECNTPITIERNLLASHNAGIQAWYAGAVAYVQARQQAYYQQEAQAQAQAVEEHREERRRFWGNVATALSAMAPPPSVNCTSNTSGPTTTTRCQ